MFHQMAGLSIQSPFTTTSVLVFHLLLIPFSRGQSQLIGSSQPIVAKIGSDIILPCHLEPAEDVAAKTLDWTRSDLDPRFVCVWRARQELLDEKNPSYSGRTSLFADELKHGNISLKLSRVKPADQGRYKCFIPNKGEESFVELVVASDAAASPVVSLSGTDRDKGGVVLQCESKGWHPEPELLWLDGEGKLLSAGPTETVRGPDDLYTVSSRVTVEKRHSNNFTCRVQQKIINQTRETQIHVPDDFFKGHSSSSVIIALAVTLAVFIVITLSLFFFILKRQNIIKTRKRQRDETDGGEKVREKLMRDETMKMEDLNNKKVEKRKKNKYEKQKNKDTEKTVETLKKELETMKKEVEDKQTELQSHREENQRRENVLKNLKEKLENKNKQLEKIKVKLSWSHSFPFSDITEKLRRKKAKVEQEVETLKTELETKETEFQTQTNEMETKESELLELQEEKQRQEENLQRLIEERETKNKENELQGQINTSPTSPSSSTGHNSTSDCTSPQVSSEESKNSHGAAKTAGQPLSSFGLFANQWK